VPSATDIVVALGAGASLLGISADCDQPDPNNPRPVVTRPLIDPAVAALDPSGVDAAVREQMAGGGLLYSLDVDTIVALAPDVVFAQDECSVCALPSSEVLAALARRDLACEIVSLDPVDLEGVLSSLSVVGRALGLADEGAALEAACRERLDRLDGGGRGGTVGEVGVKDAVGGPMDSVGGGMDAVGGGDATAAGRRQRVLVLDWVDPLFVAGNWVPDVVRAAGGEPLLALAGSPSRQISIDDLEACRPDLIVVAPCGLDLEAAQQSAEGLRLALSKRQTSSGKVSDVAGGGRIAVRMVAFDGRLWFSRPGPRLVEGAEALAAWLAGTAQPGDATSIEISEAEW
jgi:iron complex transport system substrate-binding protein